MRYSNILTSLFDMRAGNAQSSQKYHNKTDHIYKPLKMWETVFVKNHPLSQPWTWQYSNIGCEL